MLPVLSSQAFIARAQAGEDMYTGAATTPDTAPAVPATHADPAPAIAVTSGSEPAATAGADVEDEDGTKAGVGTEYTGAKTPTASTAATKDSSTIPALPAPATPLVCLWLVLQCKRICSLNNLGSLVTVLQQVVLSCGHVEANMDPADVDRALQVYRVRDSGS